MIKFIAAVEVCDNGTREQWAESPRGRGFSCSGRWADCKLYGNKKEAEKAAKRLAGLFSESEQTRKTAATVVPFVRRIVI